MKKIIVLSAGLLMTAFASSAIASGHLVVDRATGQSWYEYDDIEYRGHKKKVSLEKLASDLKKDTEKKSSKLTDEELIKAANVASKKAAEHKLIAETLTARVNERKSEARKAGKKAEEDKKAGIKTRGYYDYWGNYIVTCDYYWNGWYNSYYCN